MMPVELPASVIYAYPPVGGSSTIDNNWESQYNSLPNYVLETIRIREAARNLTYNGDAVWTASATGDPLAVMGGIFTGLSGQSAKVVEQQLKMHVMAMQYTRLNYKSSVLANSYYLGAGNAEAAEFFYGAAVNKGKLASPTGPLPSNGVDFYGTPLMPIAAIAYWLFGAGADRFVHIGSLNLVMVATDFTPITDILNNAANGPGVYQLQAAPFSYNTFNHGLSLSAAGTIGRVSGSLSGTLTIMGDGKYSFSGSYTLNPDRYDADLSNRTWYQEALTTFLRQLGETFGHTNYTINFLGSQQFEFTGSR